MDILTQGLLGGVLAQSVARKGEKRLAAIIGMFAGLLADVDYLIRSSSDPLLNLEYHRHFTHSLLFIPIGAAIALLLLWPFLHRRLTTQRLYLFCFMGYSMSGVLDACTSYGTHLFWPFSDEKVAWNIISIIDPIFTLMLLITFILGLRIPRRQIAYAGLLLSLTYMSLGFIQMQRAQQVAQTLLMARNHSTTQLLVKPTLGNLLLWRSVYIHDQRIYVDAIRVGLLSDSQIFEGDSIEQFTLQKDLPQIKTSSVLYKDIQRFMRFSDGLVAFDTSRDNVLGDTRYSMLPMSIKPLWGIIIDTRKPEQHADYQFFRDNSTQIRQKFFNMVTGRCDTADC